MSEPDPRVHLNELILLRANVLHVTDVCGWFVVVRLRESVSSVTANVCKFGAHRTLFAKKASRPSAAAARAGMSRRHQHDDEDEDEVRAKEELAANMVAPQVVPGDKVATAPGDRIAYVMFVGQLPNMPAGYWVGVQYEEKVGKNDGTLHGKRYFTCPPGHGGFLRSAKVQSLEDLASKNEAREAALVAEAQGQNRRKSTGKALSTSAKGKSSTSPKSGRPGETFDQPEDEGKELGEAEAQTPSAGGLCTLRDWIY